jgi:hypothetical protein
MRRGYVQRLVYTHVFLIMQWNDEKLATRGLAVLIVYAAVRCIFRALSRPFWFDELCTVALARQLGGISAIWKALSHGADSHPPTFYFVERLADYLVSNPQLAFRLPSILGFCCMVASVFIFLRRHGDAVRALLCSALTLMSVFYDPYAVDARGYALMCACIAIALVSYQRANAKPWVLLMGLSLAVAPTFQYYAVCSLFPFAIAECCFCLQNRRVRLQVWAAIASGLFPLIAFWPLLSRLKEYYGNGFWAKATISGTLNVFGWFLNVGPFWGIAITATAFIGVVASMVADYVEIDSGPHEARDLFHERALVLGLLALPFAIFTAMKITHGGFTDRYALPAGLGVPLAAGCILPRLDRKVVALFAVLVCFGLAAQEGFFWKQQISHPGKLISPAIAAEKLVNAAGHQDLSVVVSSALDFFPLVYYGSPALEHAFSRSLIPRKRKPTPQLTVLISSC